jgi:hypothetical protein
MKTIKKQAPCSIVRFFHFNFNMFILFNILIHLLFVRICVAIWNSKKRERSQKQVGFSDIGKGKAVLATEQ